MVLGVAVDAHAQRMTFIHTPPATGQAGKALELSGNVFGGSDLAKARCRYRQKGGAWKQAELGLEYGDFFRAIIPGREVIPPSIEYYCIGFDFFGGQTELFASPSAPRKIRVTGDYIAKLAGEDDDKPPVKEPPKEPVVDPDEEKPRGKKPKEPEVKRDPEEPVKPKGKKPKVAVKPAESEEDREAREKDEEVALFGAEDVVTLATRQAQSVSDAPAIATGVPEDQMRQLGLRTLPEVLKTVPGFETSRDVQGFNRVAARGIRDEAALLVLIDGHKLNSAYDSRALLGLSTENVERIEVIRGPGSSLYGTGAFLGVVNVVSKRRETAEMAVSSGSFGTVDGHASGGTRLSPDAVLYGDVDLSRTDGYRRPITRDSLSVPLERAGLKDPDAPAGLTRDDRLFANAGAELRYGAPGSGQARLAARFIREDRGPLIGLFDAAGPDSRLIWNVLLLDAVYDQPVPSGSLSGRVFFDHQQVDRLFQIAPANFPLSASVTATNGLLEQTKFSAQTIGAEGNLALTLGTSNKLSLGLSGSLERLPSYAYTVNFERGQVFPDMRPLSNFDPPQGTSELNHRLVAGAYAQDVIKFAKAFSVTVGARADVTQLPKLDPSQPPRTAKIIGTQFVPSFSPRLGMVLTPTEGLSFKLLYGHAFRAPTMQELADKTPNTDFSQGRFEGYPGLEPATIDTVELGGETVTAVGESKVRLRANGFFNNFEKLISAIDTSGNVVPLINEKGAVRVIGAEAELRFEVTNRAYTFMNYAWFRATDLGATPGFQLLVDTPQYRFNWALHLPLGRWLNVSVLTELGAERRNNGRSKLEIIRHFKIPAYALVGAQLRTEPIADLFEIAVTGQNIFNYDLQDDVPRSDRVTGLLPREGPGLYATVRAKF